MLGFTRPRAALLWLAVNEKIFLILELSVSSIVQALRADVSQCHTIAFFQGPLHRLAVILSELLLPVSQPPPRSPFRPRPGASLFRAERFPVEDPAVCQVLEKGPHTRVSFALHDGLLFLAECLEHTQSAASTTEHERRLLELSVLKCVRALCIGAETQLRLLLMNSELLRTLRSMYSNEQVACLC